MGFKNLPDHLLIQKCREGNSKAFDQLFFRYFSRLYKYTIHHTGNEQLAEELVMDLMLWIWNKKETIEVKGDLSSYLFKAIKNAIYNHFRKIELDTIPIDLIIVDPPAYDNIDDQIAARELEEEYQLSLTMLTPQRRKVFELSREQDMTYAEIAGHLNLSVKTVEAHVSASLQFMRKRFKNYADLVTLIVVLNLLK
ncbi:RNA polymerase sigma-70 factor, ECF subfamily [Mucilaginibacter pineti]|uniref:RNA polymerase sigma-70 factor, ECF subfamily n=1 Tax=Mucilaginibacter pineti TaxID=1391627 RepID=A0A1G6XI46_9SPHI|nr:RNA polymerase sigma-70 factor [Mucilaginibacter pineti]SDD77741.1 RNA polymerase sigma-70 factor, ECF subfamily [Mucilaginibacter pineti]